MRSEPKPRRSRLFRSFVVLLALVALAGGVTARYVMVQDREAEMISAGFHMSSDTLAEVELGGTAPSYAIATDADGSFAVNLYNWEVENVASVSQVDVDYAVTVAGGTLRGSAPVTLSTGGSEVAADANGRRTLASGSAIAHMLHIVPSGQTVTVTVESSSPYAKTMAAQFTGSLPTASSQADLVQSGLTAQVEPNAATGMSRVVVQTNQFEGTLKVTWPQGLVPAAGVVDGAQGWSVDYGNRTATLAGVGKLETREFEFVGAAPAAGPTVTVAAGEPKTATVAVEASS